MPNLIKQGPTKITTKDGEVFVNIAIELTLKLDGSNLQMMSDGSSVGLNKMERPEEKVSWEIPDFTSNKINFGK